MTTVRVSEILERFSRGENFDETTLNTVANYLATKITSGTKLTNLEDDFYQDETHRVNSAVESLRRPGARPVQPRRNRGMVWAIAVIGIILLTATIYALARSQGYLGGPSPSSTAAGAPTATSAPAVPTSTATTVGATATPNPAVVATSAPGVCTNLQPTGVQLVAGNVGTTSGFVAQNSLGGKGIRVEAKTTKGEIELAFPDATYVALTGNVSGGVFWPMGAKCLPGDLITDAIGAAKRRGNLGYVPTANLTTGYGITAVTR